MRRSTFLTLALVAWLTSPLTAQTILIMEENTSDSDPTYGDNVSASPQGGFVYGGGVAGFTPNISLDVATADLGWWANDFGDLQNVWWGGRRPTIDITFAADPHFSVTLESFDMAGWRGGDRSVSFITVTDETDSVIYSHPSTTVSGTTHTTFMPGVTSRILHLQIGLDDPANTAIDNIKFSQSAVPVPEPSAFWYLSLVGAGCAWLKWRRRITIQRFPERVAND